jgi:hypothetical protein
LEEIVGVPASLLASAFDARALGLLLAQEVECDVAEHREVLGGIPGTNPALILLESDIEDPMHPVLDPQ